MTQSLRRPPGMQTALYRFFDAVGDLLYVGIANDPRPRWSCHAGEKRWWGEVHKKTLEWFATREEAEHAEMTAIVNEQPRYNVTHSVTRRPGDARKDNTGRYRHLAKFRMLNSEWALFGQAAKAAGTNRSALLLEFMAWYMRRPGAKRPQRPPAGPWSVRLPGETGGQAAPKAAAVQSPPTFNLQLERLAEIGKAAAEFQRARKELERLVREARSAGVSLGAIAQHAGFSREWVRYVADSSQARKHA
jgi:GIY-YIG catalytic domain.